MRALVLIVAAAAVVPVWGCAGRGQTSGASEALRALPPRHDPPLDLSEDDDLGRARALFDALPLDDPGRATRRRELAEAYSLGITGEPRASFRRFQSAIGLWDARELAEPEQPVVDLQLLTAPAEQLLKRASTSGADLEAITALAVLRAAHPERAVELDRTFKDILTYTNELAITESGPGAERSRVILALESATQVFPSRWAADRLIELYLARQDVVQKAIASGSKQEVLGVHRDPGVIRPVWNLVRIHARLRRLGDAPPVVDRLAGQFGDEPELRKRLGAALAGGDGKAWVGLMAAYVPSETGGEGDADVARVICEEGAGRLPAAVEPRKCAGEIARVTGGVPIALRWIREAWALAPDDLDVAEIYARLHVMRLGDLLAAERLEAAHQVVAEAEAFYADVGRRLRGKSLDTSLADLLLTFGRGLYTQGEIGEAVAVLERARRLEDTPDAAEELATIAMKTGRYPEAQRGYQLAAAAPRPTPIETTFDGNRLRRLAGEAAWFAGDRHQADSLWRQALASWNEVVGATLPPRARAQAFSELGRLYYDLGDTGKSLQSLNAAVDSDPEQGGTYGDVIAFLATRGLYDEALDAYHRAMGRAEVSDYLKAYTSLWMVDLARLRGAAPDPAATDFLTAIEGGEKWYHQLARFKLGKLSFDELRARADTRGKRAEAYFYQAMARYAAGDPAGARRLLEAVISTQMLGFFEYDMARHYLRNGPPVPAARRAVPET